MSVLVNGSCSRQITKYAYPGLEPAADGSPTAARRHWTLFRKIPRNASLRRNQKSYILVCGVQISYGSAALGDTFSTISQRYGVSRAGLATTPGYVPVPGRCLRETTGPAIWQSAEPSR